MKEKEHDFTFAIFEKPLITGLGVSESTSNKIDAALEDIWNESFLSANKEEPVEAVKSAIVAFDRANELIAMAIIEGRANAIEVGVERVLNDLSEKFSGGSRRSTPVAGL